MTEAPLPVAFRDGALFIRDAAAGLPAGISEYATAGSTTLLADISEFQPDISDATYLAWSKAVVIRACYGAFHTDKAWYGGQRRALLHQGGAKFVGIYQYLVNGQDGASQANALHALVGKLQPGEVLIADFEEGSKPMLTAWYNQMLALGYPAKYLWTYTGLYFGQNQGVLPVQWIAAYGQSEPATAHTLWQFTSAFAVPGVGSCDCSVFHGTVDQLAALAYQAPAPTPIPPPVNWTYGPPTNLHVTAGYTSFRPTWNAPPLLGHPAPAGYWVYVYENADLHRLVASYPRTYVQSGQLLGGLKRHVKYLVRVVTVGANGTHVRPGTFAQTTFTTG